MGSRWIYAPRVIVGYSYFPPYLDRDCPKNHSWRVQLCRRMCGDGFARLLAIPEGLGSALGLGYARNVKKLECELG